MAASSNYPKKLVQGLNILRQENQFCDINISISGRTFQAHKNVLAACSSYFMAMFTSGFKESSQSEISIDGDPEVFQVLLEFVYTGYLNVTLETVRSVLEMACYMQLSNASQCCADFVINQIKYYVISNDIMPVSEVLKIYEIAQNHVHLKELTKKLEKFLCEQYKELKSSEVFLEMASTEFMKQFLKCDDLSSKDEEEEVLKLVVSWLKHDWENRRPHAPTLLQEVRLGLVPQESLTELLAEDILDMPECKELTEVTFKERQSGVSMFELSKKIPQLFGTRSTITAPITFVAQRNPVTFQMDSSPTLYFFDESDGQWQQLHTFPALSNLPSVIVVNGILYAAGADGLLERYGVDDFVCYDLQQNRWKVLPCMYTPRHSVHLVHQEGAIYAIGGFYRDFKYNENVMAYTIERYDIAENEWSTLAPLPKYQLKSAVSYMGKIFVYCTDIHESIYMIFVYDSSTNTWIRCRKRSIPGKVPTRLFPYNNILYLVRYWDLPLQVTVNKLCVSDNGAKIKLGEEVKQDLIPENRVGAFRVQDDVFINVNGFIHRTSLKIASNQPTEVDLGNWNHLDVRDAFGVGSVSNITTFTFDKK